MKLVKTGSFDWKNAGLATIWSALQHSDHILSVGYKPASEGDIDNQNGLDRLSS